MNRWDPKEARARLGWILAFAGVLALALLLLTVTSWLEGVANAWSTGPLLWLTHLDTDAAVDTLSNAAEVVAAVLAIAITVVAIVVELAANRYTHRITQLFVRTPVNLVILGFFVLTTVECLWISATLGARNPDAAVLPFAGVALCMGMVTVSLAVLLPYFAYVFAFLDPVNVVKRIRRHTLEDIQAVARNPRLKLRSSVVEGIEQLQDVALNAIEHKDRAIAMASVDALNELLEGYEALAESLTDPWFEVAGSLAHDPDFVSMDSRALEEINSHRVWFELKVLRRYHALFTESLNRVRDLANLIALQTRKVASRNLQREPEVFDLGVRFFNSYLRAAVNAGDVRTAYYVLHQYRLLAEEALRNGSSERLIEIVGHFRYYGLLAFTQGLPFLLEAVAYDVGCLAELAVENGSPAADEVLSVFLQVDKESESPDQETSLRGVRRAQVQLATYLLLRGDRERARRIYQDMAHERPERLASIRDELLTEDRIQYWEITDRFVNFAYLAPDRRACLPEFFAWFGDRLPRKRSTRPQRTPSSVPGPDLR